MISPLHITAEGTKTSKFVNNSHRFSLYFDVWKFGADGRDWKATSTTGNDVF